MITIFNLIGGFGRGSLNQAPTISSITVTGTTTLRINLKNQDSGTVFAV